MRNAKLYLSAAALAVAAFAQPASALTFNFTNQAQGGAEQGTAARRSFQAAANYWSSVLTNNATVNIAIGFYSLGAGNENVLGSAGSNVGVTTVTNIENRIVAGRSNSGVDQRAASNLPVTTNGGISMLTPGYVDPVAKTGINTATRVWDTDNTVNNQRIYGTTANLKALGLIAANSAATDAQIQFNSDFQFDFDPTDGIDAGKTDFTLVALHEIGHALGFVSGVDDYDYFGGPSGPCFAGGANCGGITGATYNANGDYWGSVLDLFRYSKDADNVAPGTNPVLDWSIRNPNDPIAYPDYTANPYFSIDGGTTLGLGGEQAYFSRGQYNGFSFQASHWRRNGANNGIGNPTQPYVGIMDPVGQTGNFVTALDIAAFDAIGWNSTVDAFNDRSYARTTAQIFGAFAPEAPEPATWAQMLVGFGLLGFIVRRRGKVATVTA